MDKLKFVKGKKIFKQINVNIYVATRAHQGYI